MGIPYSKQINYAFDQVTPLVAAGFEVLKTTKNIAILLAFVQVFTAAVLSLIFFALLGVLWSTNPDLEEERHQIVTPVMKWLASWVVEYGHAVLWGAKVGLVGAVALGGVAVWHGGLAGTRVPGEGAEGDQVEGGEYGKGKNGEGPVGDG
ncbi:hypothetical protein BJ170DRAFT_680958 [Xylariales sp. AK1849]|nr:hypothetical protein BJ170DRAFT_680958 [Xylariales sp. AK1849]